MDGVDPDVITSAEQAVMGIDGVRHAHARARWTGRTLRLEIEAWLDASTTVAAGDALGREAADRIGQELPDVRSLTWITRAA
jgi:divalent metal cation (Fe/Co/Zn/Cd) transporter